MKHKISVGALPDCGSSLLHFDLFWNTGKFSQNGGYFRKYDEYNQYQYLVT